MNDIDRFYLEAKQSVSDINEHIERMRDLGRECAHITEMGSRYGISTIAWVAARPQRLVCYDLARHASIDPIERAAQADGIEFIFHVEDVRYVSIESTDLLFIDTLHVYEQLKVELALHADKARKYIVMHDTETFGERGGGEAGEIPGAVGLWPAILEFLEENRAWTLSERRTNNNGLTVLSRK